MPLSANGPDAGKVLGGEDLAGIFGLDMAADTGPERKTKKKPAAKVAPRKRAGAKPPTQTEENPVRGMAALCLTALAVPVAIWAQLPDAAPKFEVASIKRNAGGAPVNSVELGLMRAIARGSRGGRFQVPNASLHLLIQLAYGVRDYQIVGEPSWAASDGFAITAKAEGNASFEQMRPMLQSLLADRFQFLVHRETRQLPVYELAAAKGGLKIAPSKAGSCVTLDPQGPAPGFGSKICGGERIGIGRMEGFGVTMPKLAPALSDRIGRPCRNWRSFFSDRIGRTRRSTGRASCGRFDRAARPSEN